MNKFLNLADKLIKGKLWSSEIILIELEQSKNSSNRVVYIDGHSEKLNCVKKELTKKLNEDVFEYVSEFFISLKSLVNFDLTKKFAIKYNGKRYFVEDIVRLGTMNNEDALVKMVVKR